MLLIIMWFVSVLCSSTVGKMLFLYFICFIWLYWSIFYFLLIQDIPTGVWVNICCLASLIFSFCFCSFVKFSLFFSFCLSVRLSPFVCLSVYLFVCVYAITWLFSGLYVYFSVCLSVCLPAVFLALCLPAVSLSVIPSCLSTRLPARRPWLSTCQFACLSFCLCLLAVFLSVCLPTFNLSACLSGCLPICLSVFLLQKEWRAFFQVLIVWLMCLSVVAVTFSISMSLVWPSGWMCEWRLTTLPLDEPPRTAPQAGADPPLQAGPWARRPGSSPRHSPCTSAWVPAAASDLLGLTLC